MSELQHVAGNQGAISAEDVLYSPDDPARVEQFVGLGPCALIVRDGVAAFDVRVVDDEVLLDQNDKGLLDGLDRQVGVDDDLVDWETAALEEDENDFLGCESIPA